MKSLPVLASLPLSQSPGYSSWLIPNYFVIDIALKRALWQHFGNGNSEGPCYWLKDKGAGIGDIGANC